MRVSQFQLSMTISSRLFNVFLGVQFIALEATCPLVGSSLSLDVYLITVVGRVSQVPAVQHARRSCNKSC
jgi:hypothetical protein